MPDRKLIDRSRFAELARSVAGLALARTARALPESQGAEPPHPLDAWHLPKRETHEDFSLMLSSTIHDD